MVVILIGSCVGGVGYNELLGFPRERAFNNRALVYVVRSVEWACNIP